MVLGRHVGHMLSHRGAFISAMALYKAHMPTLFLGDVWAVLGIVGPLFSIFV